MKKEQNKRYEKLDLHTEIKSDDKPKKTLSNKAKISILVITGLLALASIVGLVILLANILN